MPTASRRRRTVGGAIALTLIAALLGPGGGSASAAGPPIIGEQWASAVGSATANLSAQIDPNGSNATYHVEYLTEAAYQANGGGFAGALRSPASGEASLGTSPLTVTRQLFSLAATTAYRYRVVAQNSDPASPTISAAGTFTTKGPGPLLLDNRGWEMVSPIDKGGGQVELPGAISGGGTLQASADGDSATYGSTGSFAGGLGGPQANQYLAARTSSGWSTQNITAPISYQSEDGGVPHQLFSADLARSLLQNGDHCAGGAGQCTLANLPLPDTDAPPGYQDYYLFEVASGAYEALVGQSEIANSTIPPAYFDLRFAGASADLRHIVVSSCTRLSAEAGEVPSGQGCDPAQQNLYAWSPGEDLTLISGPTPGATLATGPGAVSEGGDRIYFARAGNLSLHQGSTSAQIDADAGGGGSFQAASSDGSLAFFTVAGHLWRYEVGSGHAADLTPGGGVVGVLGASDSADTVYFQDGAGLKRWHSGATTQVAPNQASPPATAAAASDYPPATATVRVSEDGAQLLFLSRARLTGYDNTDLITGEPDSEVFLYDANGPSLTCVSCNPTNARPLGPSTIPGATQNGTAPLSTHTYKSRALSEDGKRVFFDSLDSLVLTDTNSNHTTGAGIADVYEWEAQGEGSCAVAGGCVALISSGRSAGGARFVDASADGSGAFFITDDSLLAADPGSLDLYDARVGGGFPVPSPPIPCEGDACQILPPAPIDPTLTTLLTGHGNPPVQYSQYDKSHGALRCKAGNVKRHGRCVKKKHKRQMRHRRGGRR